MKKVIIISSSPRRGGNSDTLCDRFLQGAQESGHTAEKIFLRDHSIGYCVGCGYCFDNQKCSRKDDMAAILDKLVDADVIVFATPVYFYSMDAQMKTFIDRTTPRYAEMKNKDFYFITTAADEDKANLHRTMEAFRGFRVILLFTRLSTSGSSSTTPRRMVTVILVGFAGPSTVTPMTARAMPSSAVSTRSTFAGFLIL